MPKNAATVQQLLLDIYRFQFHFIMIILTICLIFDWIFDLIFNLSSAETPPPRACETGGRALGLASHSVSFIPRAAGCLPHEGRAVAQVLRAWALEVTGLGPA